MARKIGRNEKCPCGSGVKYKRCCGASTRLDKRSPQGQMLQPAVLPPEVAHAILEHQEKERERIWKFGHVRPIISADHQGYKFIAVGNRLHYAKKWKTFHDFLFDYIKTVLNGEWGKAEFQKPFEERHPVLQWYHRVCEFQRRIIKVPGEVYSGTATGPVLAYMALAYDLYTLDHHTLLQQKLVKRLKVKDQFQGARYETYVAAAFIRAGFDVVLEDEGDRAITHCEFTATHLETGLRYSVEAKSRHRAGVLGRPGEPQPLEQIKADVSRLLRRALRKQADYERIIFIDVNMPPHQGGPFEADLFKEAARELDRLEQTQSQADLWPPAFVFFTNHPHHYVGTDDPEPGRTTIYTAINVPEFKQPNIDVVRKKYPVIDLLFQSVLTHTKIPHEF